jgi:hypothetical protein
VAVYNYPAEDDLKVIKCCVSLFLKSRNARARDMMAKSIRHVLNKYGITQLNLGTFSVWAIGSKYAVVEAVGLSISSPEPSTVTPGSPGGGR